MPRMAYDRHSLLIWRGKDVLKFLNGLSTNKIETLDVNRLITTIVLNNKAKIIDVLHVFNLNETIITLGNQGNAANLFSFINQKILTHDIQIQDISELNNVCLVFGENNNIDMNNVCSKNDVTKINIDGKYSFEIYSTKIIRNLEYSTIQEFNDWRVENYIPWIGYEIGNSCNPYQCGLDKYIHENKGCFTGQEILTRMRSRGKGMYQLAQTSDSNEENITTHGSDMSMYLKKL